MEAERLAAERRLEEAQMAREERETREVSVTADEERVMWKNNEVPASAYVGNEGMDVDGEEVEGGKESGGGQKGQEWGMVCWQDEKGITRFGVSSTLLLALLLILILAYDIVAISQVPSVFQARSKMHGVEQQKLRCVLYGEAQMRRTVGCRRDEGEREWKDEGEGEGGKGEEGEREDEVHRGWACDSQEKTGRFIACSWAVEVGRRLERGGRIV